jgi:hypothetical protein
MVMHHLDWYHNQQEKKKEHMKNNEIFLINQELKRLLQRLQSFINRQDYVQEARKANRFVVQSSIWDVGYRNNMESEKVAVEQALLILTIVKREEELAHSHAIKNETERLMRRLGNVDWSVYTDFRRQSQRI